MFGKPTQFGQQALKNIFNNPTMYNVNPMIRRGLPGDNTFQTLNAIQMAGGIDAASKMGYKGNFATGQGMQNRKNPKHPHAFYFWPDMVYGQQQARPKPKPAAPAQSAPQQFGDGYGFTQPGGDLHSYWYYLMGGEPGSSAGSPFPPILF